MSWYKNPDFEEKKYDPDSKFLNKAIAPGESMVLTFTSIQEKIRPEGTTIGEEGDSYYSFFFKDEKGEERQLDQNSPKGMFFRAMRGAEVDEGTKVSISREGEKIDTIWTVDKIVDNEGTKEVDKKDIPF